VCEDARRAAQVPRKSTEPLPTPRLLTDIRLYYLRSIAEVSIILICLMSALPSRPKLGLTDDERLFAQNS
jgi:hypothetical protein